MLRLKMVSWGLSGRFGVHHEARSLGLQRRRRDTLEKKQLRGSKLRRFHSDSPPSSHWRRRHSEAVNYTNVRRTTDVLLVLNVKFMPELTDASRWSSRPQTEEILRLLKNLLTLCGGKISPSSSESLVRHSAALSLIGNLLLLHVATLNLAFF